MSDKVDQEAGNDNAARKPARVNPRILIHFSVQRLLRLDAMLASSEIEGFTRNLAVWLVEGGYRALHGVREEGGPPDTPARNVLVGQVFRLAREEKPAPKAAQEIVGTLVSLFPSLSDQLLDAERLERIEAAIRDERGKIEAGKPEHAWASIARVWTGIEAKDQPWKNWKSAWEKREKAMNELIEALSDDD